MDKKERYYGTFVRGNSFEKSYESQSKANTK